MLKAFVGEVDVFLFVQGTERVKHRQVMVIGGNGKTGDGSLLVIVYQGVVIVVGQPLSGPGVELGGPVHHTWVILLGAEPAQVVDDVAAADDEHAAVAQGSQFTAQVIVEPGWLS